MKFLICLALLFAVAQANPGIVAPLTYSAVPTVATYAASPYAYAAPAVATYSHAAYSAPAVATYSHVAAPAVYSAPVARVAAVAPVAYSAPVVSTLLKK
ncbi:cuticle protein 16.5-like [Bactrocera neohumeralis]|uniref:cuticle protein 16.5-like n=1 Tax=Bactrocera tryoni TaxID=59916 RepID=UPI001A997BD9|nr:cuticle protein 16.5-like [Bactrocera tryoni]XP_050332292.1 cuticle protein 16.5-like [Bactrocera neohumeralis]